jgi:hypothetical protein
MLRLYCVNAFLSFLSQLTYFCQKLEAFDFFRSMQRRCEHVISHVKALSLERFLVQGKETSIELVCRFPIRHKSPFPNVSGKASRRKPRW